MFYITIRFTQALPRDVTAIALVLNHLPIPTPHQVALWEPLYLAEVVLPVKLPNRVLCPHPKHSPGMDDTASAFTAFIRGGAPPAPWIQFAPWLNAQPPGCGSLNTLPPICSLPSSTITSHPAAEDSSQHEHMQDQGLHLHPAHVLQ